MSLLDPRGALCLGDDDSLGVSSALVRAARTVMAEQHGLDDPASMLALEMCRWQQGLTARERDSLFLLCLVVMLSRSRGSTCLPLAVDEPFEEVLTPLADLGLLDMPPLATAAVIRGLVASHRFPTLIGLPGNVRPLIVDRGHLYIEKLWQSEDRFATRFKSLARKQHDPAWVAQAQAGLADLINLGARGNTASRSLTKEQQEAVLAATTHGVTLITGGPGTGKTTIIVSILRLLRRLGVKPSEIALATPTGRASYRMFEAIREGMAGTASTDPIDDISSMEPPQTIHRLLAASGDGSHFRHHEGSRLTYRFVIIDESSMVELDIMARLLSALAPDSSLVLLGDADQLPAVRAGAVFRDTASAPPQSVASGYSVVKLTENHRSSLANPNGRNIVIVAAKIRDGQVARLFDSLDPTDEVIAPIAAVSDLPLTKTRWLDTSASPKILQRFLKKWHELNTSHAVDDSAKTFKAHDNQLDPLAKPRLDSLFQVHASARLLCMTNAGPTGVLAVNDVLHRLASRGSDRAIPEWLPGEPVMMTTNNYRLNIYNGDMGVVLKVEADGEAAHLMAVFQRTSGYLLCSLAELGEDLVHAYATTVHKAQGGEHRHVALILPHEDSTMNTRELIYTAVTRAMESVTIVGSKAVLEAGVGRRTVRYTRLRERLGASVANGNDEDSK